MTTAEKLVSLFLLAVASAACGTSGGGDFSSAPGREYSDRIASGFLRLGASDERSRCFSDRLTRGDRETAAEAARIVEEAADKDDMRRRVLSADAATERAFVGANFGCTLYK